MRPVSFLYSMVLAVACMVSSMVSAQDVPELIPYRDAEQNWGYCNEAKEIIIPCKFDRAFPFDKGVAWVWIYKKGYGLIDKTGKFLYEPRSEYPSMGMKTEQRMPVQENGKFGFIDPSGKVKVTPRYDKAFYNEEVDIITFKRNDQWGLANASGKEIVAPTFEELSAFSEGMAAAKMKGKWGFINTKGKWVIAPQFDVAYRFSSGYAAVKGKEGWNYVQPNGKMPSDQWLDSVYTYTGGVGVLRSGITYVFMDKGFDVTALVDLKSVWDFEDGVAVAQDTSGKYGIMSAEGKWVVEPKFSDMGTRIVGGLVPASVDGKWGYVNIEGQWVLPPRYVFAYSFEMGLGEVTMKMKDWTEDGFVDKKGRTYWDTKDVID